MGIPLSIAFVASVLLNLWGCTLGMLHFFPSSLSLVSIPLIPSRLFGLFNVTKSAGFSLFLFSYYNPPYNRVYEF